jgi:spoIIIJ-associated protein
MKNEVVVTASSIEEAIEEALKQLNAQREDVEVEVLKEAEKKIFGGKTEAEVRVFLLEEEDEESSAFNEEDEPEEKDEEASNENDDEGFHDDEDEKSYNRVEKELTEEELDTVADTTIEVLRSILGYFGAEEAEIDEYEGEEGELILDIVGDNLALLIGRHGKTLDSLQFLVSAIVSKKLGFRYPVVIDVEGYKQRRKQKIVSVAKSSAARAIRQKQEVKLRPMNPYERRIIHIALRDDRRVVTHSEGVEPERCVVIKPA